MRTMMMLQSWAVKLLSHKHALHVRGSREDCIVHDVRYGCVFCVHSLHIQLGGTTVRLPNVHKILSDVDFGPSKSPAISEFRTNPIDNAVLHFTRDNIDGSLCNECKKLIVQIICHKSVSILWLSVQVCSLTMKCLAHQFVPSTSMSIQFVSKLLTIPQLIQVPSWRGGHPGKNLKLGTIALPSCFPILNISPRISWRVPTCRRTMCCRFCVLFVPSC